MNHAPLIDDRQIGALRAWIARLASRANLADFDEQTQLAPVRDALQIWQQDETVVGSAYVDRYDNLWYETVPGFPSLIELEDEIVAWGMACLRARYPGVDGLPTLDFSCQADDHLRLQMLARHGFEQQALRTLKFARSLETALPDFPLPGGFSVRPVRGEQEAADLVALHRAAFGTDHMTVEERLAMMRAAGYRPALDLVAVAPGGDLAAFCVCGFDEPAQKCAYTDPIGVHPRYRRQGLAKALLSAGLRLLKTGGAEIVELGTSSDNLPMQKLARALGYRLVSEKLWFSKII